MTAGEKAIEALKLLMTCPHADLGDFIYIVRDHEMGGWEGPSVTQWQKGVTAAEEAMRLAVKEGIW